VEFNKFTSDHIMQVPDSGPHQYEGNNYEDDCVMKSASDVDNDENESAESARSHQVQRLRGGADDDENETYIEYYDYDEFHDDEQCELGPVIARTEYQHENVFSFKLNPGIHHDSAYYEELDDLPDPRIYDINVDDLHMHMLLHMSYPDRPNPVSCYIQYLRHVDKIKSHFQEYIDEAWKSLDKPITGPHGKPRYPVVKSVVNNHSLIVHLIATNSDPVVRSRQIKIAIESYVRKIEPHFGRKLDEEFYNNVDWDSFTRAPQPKDAFLRWHRWRCYFLNRLHRYSILQDYDVRNMSMIDDHPEGPPQWRYVDELRAKKRNWFYMDSRTIQYFKIPCGFQEEVIPVDPRSPIGDIAFWDQIPLWKLPPHFEFLPLQRIFNNQATPFESPDVLKRNFKLAVFMQQTTSCPKWGSSVQQKKLVVEIDNGWGPATKDEVTANNEDVVDHEERRVEIIDVSDNEGEEQFPPPPKRPKVVHESSDNRNLGT
jgi:hypothetical protein